MTTPRPLFTLRGLLLFALLALTALASPAQVSDFKAFGAIPVQDGGRVMPMDSYARLKLLQLSGKSTYRRQPAVQWLARLVFTPDRAHDDKVILIDHPELLEAIGVPHDGRRYSFNQIESGISKMQELARAALNKEEKERTPLDQEVLRVFQNVSTYYELFHSFSFARPDPELAVADAGLREALQLDPAAEAPSFLDLVRHSEVLSREFSGLNHQDQTTWTPRQKEAFRISSELFERSRSFRGLPIALIPIHGHGQESWVSPWDALAMNLPGDEIHGDIDTLAALTRSFLAGRQADFDTAAAQSAQRITARAGESRSLKYLATELFYNRLDPFYISEILYGFGFLLCMGFFLAERRPLFLGALALTALALVPHTIGLVARMLIMGRPPVTNLFATFVFVGWICVLLGLVIERVQRNGLGVLMASLSGLALLLISGRFSTQGDTLSVVVAVLDSNFWLATHVVAISIGYAGCVAAGIAGHLYLLRGLRCAADDARLRGLGRSVFGLLAFGLIFSFLGTMLGGVWADQSWGRFWGWDPKENGALLIVLWCAILFHARASGWIADPGLAAGSVVGVIVVLMAWLGINLLGVGLHSYGFTPRRLCKQHSTTSSVTAMKACFLPAGIFTIAGALYSPRSSPSCQASTVPRETSVM